MPAAYSEFGLIEKIKHRFAALNSASIEGIGDDCAILSDGSLVVTADMLVEDVHFRRSMAAFDLGVRSVEVNLSDVASMGATPVGILLSIALPDWADERWTDEFFDGIHSCGVPLIGGDTTRSRAGLCINITAIGQAPASNIKRRSAAQIGDRILVAGTLGASATSNYTAAVRAQRDEGVWFGTREEVGAMMDLSDGLSGDLPHILHASGVGAVVELDDIPLDERATLEQALGGGEDYKLLLTARADRAAELQRDFAEHFGTPLYDIGAICDGSTLLYTRSGTAASINVTGFRHF